MAAAAVAEGNRRQSKRRMVLRTRRRSSAGAILELATMADTTPRHGEEVLERTREDIKEPQLFKVLLLNDDYTTMDFVIQVLETIFLKSPAEAFRIMMHVHTQGKGLCGLYPFDIAETKVAAVHDLAQESGFPLRAAMEEA
jgi:ATP-dependent Clp protease adaptor protein ClpS